MSEPGCKTPVAFFIFNRPDTTERVFAEIARAKPQQLLVIADGPRSNAPNDSAKCISVRKIIETVDWSCDVVTNFSEVNLGCRNRMASGLNWVFDTVDEAIVLEDDCVPHPTFFRFCEEMLERYRRDERIMQICGTNILDGWKRNPAYSYYFSKYGPIWGWASWRRAWKLYDVDMKLWPACKLNHVYKDFCQNQSEEEQRIEIYDGVYANKIDTWDYQWGFAKLINSGLSVTPNVNLISNIGFRDDATHTTKRGPLAEKVLGEMEFPLAHPTHILADSISDKKYYNACSLNNSLKSRLQKKIAALTLRN